MKKINILLLLIIFMSFNLYSYDTGLFSDWGDTVEVEIEGLEILSITNEFQSVVDDTALIKVVVSLFSTGDSIAFYLNGVQQGDTELLTDFETEKVITTYPYSELLVEVVIVTIHDHTSTDSIYLTEYGFLSAWGDTVEVEIEGILQITFPPNNYDTTVSNITIKGSAKNVDVGDTIEIYLNTILDTTIVLIDENWQADINLISGNNTITAILYTDGETVSQTITVILSGIFDYKTIKTQQELITELSAIYGSYATFHNLIQAIKQTESITENISTNEVLVKISK